MDFMQAVKEMNVGKITKRNGVHKYRINNMDKLEHKQYDNEWVKSEVVLIILCTSKWEIFEEPKKTLSDKIDEYIDIEIPKLMFHPEDVREALKKFMDIFKKDNTFAYYKDKAEKIFGEELLK